jgi:hypothetical protein
MNAHTAIIAEPQLSDTQRLADLIAQRRAQLDECERLTDFPCVLAGVKRLKEVLWIAEANRRVGNYAAAQVQLNVHAANFDGLVTEARLHPPQWKDDTYRATQRALVEVHAVINDIWEHA